MMRLSLAAALVALPVLAATPWTPTPPPESAPAELKELLAKEDALYSSRHEAGHDVQALAVAEDAAKRFPDSADAQWRLARAAFWMAEGTKDKTKHTALAIQGWDAGKRAVKAAPTLMEAQYFTALCVGEYSHGVGILTALKEGLEAKFRDPLLVVEKKAPDIDTGGVYAALGRYKFELPWPLRSLDGSVDYFRKGLKLNPANLRCKVYLAETLWERDDSGDRKEAKAVLDEALAQTPGAYDTAEEMRSQEIGRALKARMK